MLQPYRGDFNKRFSDEQYAELVRALEEKTGTKLAFRVCETPCFFPRELLEAMAEAGRELTESLMGNAEYLRASRAAIPRQYFVANENAQPNFMTVDFGLVRAADGSLDFKLVEMQAFPSIFGYQDVMSRQYIETFGLARDLDWYLGGHDEASYWSLLGKVILGRWEPENVVLLEVEPELQKTLPDFRVYEARLGIATVDIAKVRQEGRKLLYEKDGRWVPIHRIFNRSIADEMERKGICPGFGLSDELDVEWAGQPNWYFQISKFSLPYLNHRTVPKAVFLSDWFGGEGRARLPEDRERILLKPLYSFAGKGIQFAPTDEELGAIPEAERDQYLLQERVSFEPVIETPYGWTQAEIRVMYLWPDGERMEPVMSLVRLGRGLMMGVDHNRDQRWVGGSAALFPRGDSTR